MIDPPSLEAFIGPWHGSWRTWVEPNVLHDESSISGEVKALLGGTDLLYTYTASIAGDHVEGTALIGPRQGGGCTIAWVDNWHTTGLVLCSHGDWIASGLEVTTVYRAEGDEWEWTTAMTVEAGRLVVRHWNRGPGLPRYLGVEAVLERR